MRSALIGLLILFTSKSFAQITINSADIPVPSMFNNIQLSPVAPPAPTSGPAQAWDYSAFNGTVMIPENYLPVTDTFFTNVGVDVSHAEYKDLNNQATFYEVMTGYDFNANAVEEKGYSVSYQATDLSPVTGNAQDSLIIPDQKHLITGARTFMQFPFTYGSSWHSVSRHATDFIITVSSFSLNHAPGQHVYHTYRNDSIIGWGTLRVYTISGPSIWYDVLMDKYEEYSIDSFYINGSAASPAILTPFSAAQGQKTNPYYGYNFFRTGSFNYLIRCEFSDSLYSFLLGTYQNINNITNTGETSAGKYSTLVFPNPVINGNVHVKISGIESPVSSYSIIDMNNKIIRSDKLNSPAGSLITISLDGIALGNYLLIVTDAVGKRIVTETICVQK